MYVCMYVCMYVYIIKRFQRLHNSNRQLKFFFFRDSIMAVEPSIEVLPAGWTEHISKTTGFFFLKFPECVCVYVCVCVCVYVNT